MTTLNDWSYLAAGIAVGSSLTWFLRKSSPTSSDLAPVSSQTENLLQDNLLQQVKNTELAYHQAREMSQFKAGFLARTTHELRSPLNGLIGLHQLILNDLCEDPVEEREFVAQAYERSLKLLKMIDEILSVARTDQGTNKLEIHSIQLAQVLQEVHQLTYILAANRNYSFNISLPEPEIYVLADYCWLRQILVNLVNTTFLQMEEGGIYLSASTAATNNCIYIWLDVPNHAVIYSEPIDLIESEKKINQENMEMSSGMKLLLNQKLLEAMGGKLEIIPSPITKEAKQDLTRLQISMPLAIPEAEHHHMEENLDEIDCIAPL
jgi:K+-sensing histidine kinase KdpD